MFRSLSSVNYRIWFIGALVSNVGAWMQATTQNWVVLTDLTDNDAVAVGATMALQFGPQLVLVPITGLIADRFDKRKILILTQSSLMLLAFALGALLIFGHAELWHMYLFALALGIINAVDGPARQTFVSELVDEHNMSNAVALNSASFNAARMVGPAIAGLLIVAIGSGWVFVVNAFTFLGVIGALVALRTNALRRPPRAPRARGQFVEGFRYVRGRPDLMVVFVIVFIMGAFGMNFPIFASTMAVEFSKGAGEYGILSSVLAIGSLTGALLAARRAQAQMRMVVGASGLFGVAALTAAFMPSYWTFAAVLILVGFSTVTLLTTANGLVQTTTEAAVRGRVMALYMAILMGGTPIGAPIVGWVANTFGARWALGLGALAGFIACAVGLTYGVVRHHLRLRVAPDSRWRLQFTHDGVASPVTPEEFSEQIALTSPIPLPKAKPRVKAPAQAPESRPGSRPEAPLDDRSATLTGSRR